MNDPSTPDLVFYTPTQEPIPLVLVRKRIPDPLPFYEFYHPITNVLLARTWHFANDSDVNYRFFVGPLANRKQTHCYENQTWAEACITAYLTSLCHGATAVTIEPA